MKLRLTFLLILGLLFFKSYTCISARAHANSCRQLSVLHNQQNIPADLNNYQDAAALSEFSLLNEEDDDDEVSSTKKKPLSFFSASIFNNLFLSTNCSGSLKDHQRLDGYFSYSSFDKHIFLRTLRV